MRNRKLKLEHNTMRHIMRLVVAGATIAIVINIVVVFG